MTVPTPTFAPRTSSSSGSWLERTLALIRLGRPIFLLGGFALYGIGTLAARVIGHPFAVGAYVWGQLAVTSIQLMTHYSNDYFDYEADRANRTPTRWSGGSRVLVEGELPRSAALYAALVMAACAVICMSVLAFRPGAASQRLSLVVLAVMLVLAWSYSSPPLRLHNRGLGEPTVAVIVPLLTPLSGFVIQTGHVRPLPLLLSAPLVLLQLAMILTLEFPDRAGDAAVGKRGWVILFGPAPVALLCEALIAGAFAVAWLSPRWGVPEAVARTWLWLTPLGVVQLARMARGAWRRSDAWNSLAFGAVALYFLAMVADLGALARVITALD